jgi:pimeloyl-ACP methyl ester carboxylesterase
MPHFTAADGARLHYTDEGSGRPLLCLSGLTRTGADFDYLAPHLPPLRLIRLDYRGRGGSDWTGPATYTVPQEAADVVALLDHLGLDAVPVIGTSRGGLVGMVLAATARDRIRGLLMNDVGPVLEKAGLDAIRDYVGRPPAARSHAEAAEAMASRMAGFEGVTAERWLAEARRHFRETGDGLALTYDPALREAFLAALDAEGDLWPLFDALRGLPIGLIRGANSDLLSAETAAEMRRRRPDMIYAEVPGRGHIPFLDEPEALAAVHRFLALCL